MPVTRIEIGPGIRPRDDWARLDDVQYIEKGEWNKLADIQAGSIGEIYLANVLGSWGERVKIVGMSAPAQVAENYFEMVRWAAKFHRVLKTGGIVTVIENNTPVPDPQRNIIEPFMESDRFILTEQEEIESRNGWRVPGYKLVFKKP